jgi:hypothetical protein
MRIAHTMRFLSAMVRDRWRYKCHVPEGVVAYRIVGLGCDGLRSWRDLIGAGFR